MVGERTALINQLRAILLERGMVAPQGKRKLEQFLSVLMDEQDGAGLSPRMVIPQQFTTGGKPKLLGISKRGNKYLRRQLIHGARAALPYVAERDTPLGRWAKALLERAHRNVAVVALANKLARLAWAVLRRVERFVATGMPRAA